MQYSDDEFEKILETIDLSMSPPEEEPMRQYYFIKKARGYVQELSRQAGRPLSACVKTFGCQMNFKTVTLQTA